MWILWDILAYSDKMFLLAGLFNATLHAPPHYFRLTTEERINIHVF